MSGSSFSDPIPHTDKITQRLLRSGMPLTLKTARRQRTMLLAISGIVAILAHRSYKALRHCTAGRIHGPRLAVHCPLPATAPGSIFILRFGVLSPPDRALGVLGVSV